MDASPACAAALAAYARAPIPYVAHEFLNATWEPFYCVDVADQLQEAGVAYLGSATLTDNHAALLIDESTLRSIAQLPQERQRRLALDFATNQQFRRDVFSRPADLGGARGPDCSRVGCIDDPQQLPASIRVPRGVVHFQPAFMVRLRELLARGPVTIGAAVGELSGGARGAAVSELGVSARGAADEIRRNLLYLVAAGALVPFARPSAQAVPATVASSPIPTAAERGCQPANSIVERVLADSIARQAPCVLPSELLGNGVRIGLAEAASVSRYLEGDSTGPDCVSLVRRLLRLGILKGPQ